MKKIILSLLVFTIFLLPITSFAWHWQKVAATKTDVTADTPTKLTGSDSQCQSFAIWEDTKTMQVTYYLGLTSTADVFTGVIQPGESMEVNYYDPSLSSTGIYVSTTATATIDFMSRTKQGF